MVKIGNNANFHPRKLTLKLLEQLLLKRTEFVVYDCFSMTPACDGSMLTFFNGASVEYEDPLDDKKCNAVLESFSWLLSTMLNDVAEYR